ncbi:ATP-binding protein [Nonomuraea roseoviolacea]|uniref:Non-specific serine/threonine protein kinase n=1 Tax=Nonomuraea roseoviolacea subsp. carminata TaxID=160689 RepID=A0ABT1K1P8_9ACTN|nr:AAA family ATPase [Nonomuraea roseoviolacea]MCP2347785.1 non-specific serine/threonine protein kinase [Nonomuraea roseoviolacea subsp. carminata]
MRPVADGDQTRSDPAKEASREASSFVGRRRELAAARKILSRGRLLTLTGTGGVGKTRLALRIADGLRGAYKDGVHVIELSLLETGDLLVPTVAAGMGLRDEGPDAMALLVDYLSDKRMLLVLDNCEHLLQDCARLVDRILRGAPRVRILVTSRQILGVYGEQVLAVPSLAVPDPAGPPREIARHDSVRLFADRAASVWPGFAVDARNAESVARLAQRLEGIPLAIELAAVRLRTLRLDGLMRELDDFLEVPAPGRAVTLPRHRTLRATMDWSYRLCSPAEQRLWARLSLFPGGVDLDTAEAVCGGDGIAAEVFDLIAGLVDKSVLVGERCDDGMRYRMLECIRAYGGERLQPDEDRAMRRRYVRHYHALVGGNRVDELVPEQLDRYRLLQREQPNVRAALELALSEPGMGAAALETAGTMWSFSLPSGSLTEGRYWLERSLERSPEPCAARATALWVDSMLALRQGDVASAMPRLAESQAFAADTGDERLLPYVVRIAGIAAYVAGDARRGLELLEESIALHRAVDDTAGVALDLYFAATYGSVHAPERAAALGEELLALCEARRAALSRGYAQLSLGIAAWSLDDRERAESLVREAAAFTAQINDRWCLTQCLEVLAWIACAGGEHARAAWVLGAAHALWQAVDSSPTRLWYHATWHERCVEQSRQVLGDRDFTTAFRDGARHGLDRAVIHAIGA